MVKNVVVVGLGQGGVVAAIGLAKAGAKVTIYEQNPKDQVGYAWRDDIRHDIWGKVDLPAPDETVYCQKPRWVFVSPNGKHALYIPQLPPLEEVSVQRQRLSAYLADLATKAGCTIEYGRRAVSLVTQGDQVVGVQLADGQNVMCDLVIDASGVHSVLRASVPKKWHIARDVGDSDVLVAHRSLWKPIENERTKYEGAECAMYIQPHGSEGIWWCNLTPDNEVDVLVAQVGHLSEAEVAAALDEMRREHGLLSQTKLREKWVTICFRCPLSRLVADGYCMVGDSACMPVPIAGSGIESSMLAGHMLAKWLVEHDITDCTAAAMWGWQVQCMRGFGRGFVQLDVLRRWALRLPSRRLDRAMSGKLVTDEDLAYCMLPKGVRPAFNWGSWLSKPWRLLAHPALVWGGIGCALRAWRAGRIAESIPKVWDEKRIDKWQKKYDGVISNADALQ